MSTQLSDPFAAPPRRKARIEIIPLIDVIFFLLATFVLFTLSLNKAGGLPVALPTSETGQPHDVESAVVLTITATGTLAWDKEPVTLDGFISRLQAYKTTSSDPHVLINGDENAPFAQVRYVIDEVRKAGISRILLETRVHPAGS